MRHPVSRVIAPPVRAHLVTRREGWGRWRHETTVKAFWEEGKRGKLWAVTARLGGIARAVAVGGYARVARVVLAVFVAGVLVGNTASQNGSAMAWATQNGAAPATTPPFPHNGPGLRPSFDGVELLLMDHATPPEVCSSKVPHACPCVGARRACACDTCLQQVY